MTRNAMTAWFVATTTVTNSIHCTTIQTIAAERTNVFLERKIVAKKSWRKVPGYYTCHSSFTLAHFRFNIDIFWYFKCGLGEGDCDSKEECEVGMVCAEDNCYNENADQHYDCCEVEPTCNYGGDDCCTDKLNYGLTVYHTSNYYSYEK